MSEHSEKECIEKKGEDPVIPRRALLRAGWTAPIILGVGLAAGTARGANYFGHINNHTNEGAGMTHLDRHENIILGP